MTLPRLSAMSGLGLAALQAWVFLFIAVAGTAILAAYPPLRTGAVLLYAVPVLAWAIRTVRGPATLLDVAILVGLALHVTVSLLSADPTASLESTGTVAAFAALFWLGRSLARDERVRAKVASAIAMALAFWVVVIAITWVMEKVADLQLFGWPPRVDAYQPYVWGSINTPPVLLLIGFPFLGFMSPGRLRNVLTVIFLASAVMIVPFSVGRAAWLGIMVGLIAAEWLSGFPVTQRLLGERRRRVAAMGVGAAVLAAAAFFVATRMDTIALELDSRVRLWDQAIRLFAADPVTGSGPMTFAWARLQQVPDYADRVAAGAAHNVAIQTIADGGLVLVVAMTLVAAAWARQVALARDGRTKAQRLAVASLAGYAAVTLLDDLSFLPAITVMIVLLAAWAIPAAPPAARQSSSSGVALPAALAFAILASLPSISSMTLMRFEASAGRGAALGGNWELARDRFARATELQPASALHWLSLGLAEHRLGDDKAARDAYERARLVNPGDPRTWGALAALSPNGTGEGLLGEAARRSNDPQYAWRLAMASVAGGRAFAARQALAIATIYEPNLVPAAAKVDAGLDATAIERAGTMVGSFGEVPPEIAVWNIELMRDWLDPRAPAPWVVARRVDMRDLPGADAALDKALALAPYDSRSHAAAAAVARMICDEGGYDAAQGRVKLLGGGDRRLGQPVAERRIGLYGIPDLGDYQPIDHDELPLAPMWPEGLIEVPDCGW